MSELTSLDKNFTEKRVDNETIFIQVLNNEIVMSIVGEFVPISTRTGLKFDCITAKIVEQ